MVLRTARRNFTRIRNFAAALFFAATQIMVPLSLIGVANAAGSSLSQWGNKAPVGWQNGNLNEQSSSYREGESVPFRAVLTGLSTGSHTLDIEYDNVDSSKHAYDYLTSYDRNYSPDPCLGVAVACAFGNGFTIPTDPTLGSVPQSPGQIKIFNGAITGVSYLSTPGHDLSGSKQTSLRIQFVTAQDTAVVAWGGHIAKESDWGIGNGASSIPGSPYHQRILALDGSGGSQDRSLKASAVILLPRITITKVVENGGAAPSDFSFTVSPSINGVSNYSIPLGKSSVTIYDVQPDGNYEITESGPAGYSFASGSGTNCTFDGSAATASVAEGVAADVKSASCTFSNAVRAGSITIKKNAIPDNTTDFSFTTTNLSDSSFALDNDSDPTLSDQKLFDGLLPGTYTVTEASTNGWDFDNISCSGAVNSPIVKNGATVSITLSAGANIICTYVNRQHGNIIVQKVTSPANDPTQFNITASGTNTVHSPTAQTVSTQQSVTYQVSPGTYSVSEDLTLTPGWAETSNTCSNLVINGNTPLVNGVPTVTCTITNTKLATLKIAKNAVPDGPQDFSFTTTGTGLNSFSLDDDTDGTLPNEKQFTYLMPGMYSVTEGSVYDQSGVLLWDLTDLSCLGTAEYSKNDTTLNITLAAGDQVTCTFVNTQRGSISGTKYEVNADGTIIGILSGWTIYLSHNGQQTSTTTDVTGDYSFTNLLPGDYALGEFLDDTYTQIFGIDSIIGVVAGQNKTDQDFGNFENGTISGYKWNDLNGDGIDNSEPKLSGWTIYIDADNSGALNSGDPSAITNAQGAYNFTNLAPGEYTVCEVQQVGWVQTFPAANVCHPVLISMSGENEMRNFGNQGRGTIQVIKNVDTDGDGDIDISGATDWTWDIDGSGNYATGSSRNVPAGSNVISEDQKENYHVTYSSCSGETNGIVSESLNVTVSPGENVICTFTNTRDTGTITVIKQIIADNGSTAVPADFTLHVTANEVDIAGSPVAGSTEGATFTVPTGTYEVHETAGSSVDLSDYTTTITCDWNKTRGGSAEGVISQSDLYVAANDALTCIFSNDDIAPKLTVVKQVINDNSGTSTPADFTMQITGTNIAPSANFPGSSNGTTVTLNAGTYSLNETGPSGYAASYSTDCSGTLALAETKICTVINDDVPHPGISIVKNGPSVAHEGDTITYTFTVTNTGDTVLGGTSVSDNIVGGATYQSGDVDNNNVLDRTETWIFTKNYVVPSPRVVDVINTATACASDPAGTLVCDNDSHELDILHPEISVIKYGPGLAYEGQVIGYTFLVTNTGDTKLYNVGITDDIAGSESCPKATLAPQESMTCSAIYLVPIPTLNNVTNTVTASGTDILGRAVTNTDDHTLDVLHPGIHITKSGPATAHEGNIVTYTLLVSNVGDIALGGISVTDDIAGTANYQNGDVNNNNMLDLSEVWAFSVSHTIPTPQVANVINTATACGIDPSKTEYCDDDSHELDVLHPSISVIKHGPSAAYEGETVNYSFVVTNTGDVALSNVGISDDVAVSEACPKSTLQPLESMTCTASYTIPTPQIANVINTVITSGTDTLGQTITSADSHILDVLHPTITVVKQVISTAEDDGLFNLQIDAYTHAYNIGNKGSTGPIVVSPGSHTIGETAGTDTDLDNYVITYSSNCADGLVSVTGDEHKTCIITNTRLATITVIKNVDTDGDGDIDISGATDWTWDIDGSGDFATGSSRNVPAGSYVISEDQKENYHVTYSSCSGETNGIVSESLNVTVSPGENVICTFTNTRDTGFITIHKVTYPSNDPGLFDLNINTVARAIDVPNGGSTGKVRVPTGTYEVSETAGTKTDLSDYKSSSVCILNQSEDAHFDGSAVSNIVVSTDDEISCTFYNTRYAHITVTKETIPRGDPQLFEFWSNFTHSDFSLRDGESFTSGKLLPGEYSVYEKKLNGWDLTSASCSDESDPSAIQLGAGESVNCTFVNTKRGTITIVKDAQPDHNQAFTFSFADADTTLDFTLVDDGITEAFAQKTFNNLPHGTYTITELPVDGWTLTDVSCGRENQQIAVLNDNVLTLQLMPGADLTCTLTNTRDTGTITIVKKLTPTTNPGTFNLFINDTAYARDVGNGGTTGAITLPTGSYTLSETAGQNTVLSDYESVYQCTDGDSVILSGIGTQIRGLALEKNHDIICTFTNNKGEILSITLPELVNTGVGTNTITTMSILIMGAVGLMAVLSRRRYHNNA